jgi:hypothetical protein
MLPIDMAILTTMVSSIVSLFLETRSFSIWNSTTGALVWDSKDEIEQRVLAQFPANFNAGHTTNALDDRSDNKGPEPEAVTIGKNIR